MKKIKAIIKTPEMTITVIHRSRMNYEIEVEGIGAVSGRGSLGEAMAQANKIAILGLQELKTRISHSQYGLI